MEEGIYELDKFLWTCIYACYNDSKYNFASINKDGFQNLWKNKFVEVLEQIGRMGCFGFMVFIIPRCGFGFSPDESFSLYLIVNVVLLAAYCLIWIICFKRNSIFRALALSIIPSVIFWRAEY